MDKKKINLILTMILVFAMGVGARTVNDWVKVVIARDVQVSLNGEVQKLRSVKGEEIHPIIHEETSYLPVRAIAELAGLDVDWDAESGTVLLGKEDEPREDEPREDELWEDGVQDEDVNEEKYSLPNLEDVYEDIKRDLENEKIADLFYDYLDTFKKESDIVRHEEGKVLLSVNGVELLRDEFDKEMEEAKLIVKQQFAMQGQEVDENSEDFKSYLAMIEEDIKDNFIYTELQKQLLEQGDYTVTEDEIDYEIEAFKSQFDSEEDFDGFLAAQDVSVKSLREILEGQFQQRKFVQDMGLDYEVSEQEVEEAYEKILQLQ